MTRSGRKLGWMNVGGAALMVVALAFSAATAVAQTASEVSDHVDTPAGLKGEFYIGPHIGMTFFGHKDVYCRCDVDGNDFLFLGGRAGYMFTDHLAA